MRLFELKPEYIADVWPTVEHLFNRAARFHSFARPQNVLEAALAGRSAIILGINDNGRIVAACALEILTFSRRRVANLYMLGAEAGFLREVRQSDVPRFFIDWARSRQCQAIMLTGRRGFKRFLKDLGAQQRECVHAWMEL